MKNNRVLQFLHRVSFELPENIPEKNYSVFVPQNISAIVGAITHFSFIFLFWFLEVYPLSLFNILSVALWICAYFLCQKGLHYASFNVIAIELLAHQSLCVILIGWQTSFQYYIFLVPMGVYVLPPTRYSYKIIWVFLGGFNYMLLGHLFRDAAPIFNIGPTFTSIMNYANQIFFIILFSMLFLYFHISIKKSEDKLQKEHELTSSALSEKKLAYSQLSQELSEAACYVTSLLPDPIIKGRVQTDWEFVPSESLGGDVFGYHWLDEENFSIYLLDVSGHGVGAALLSVSVLNTIRTQSLPINDFKNPDEVLYALNNVFRCEDQNDMFFTIWYGVYNSSNRTLYYVSAGHPPAILFSNGSNPLQLRTNNPVVGGMPHIKYQQGTKKVNQGDSLYIFSDGVYEIDKKDNSMMSYGEYKSFISQQHNHGVDSLNTIYENTRNLSKYEKFEDDYTIIKVKFE